MEIDESDALTAEVVAEYLRSHPDFFIHRSELVDQLSLFHQKSGAVSLVHVQMNRQRQRIEALEEEITALMSLAAGNDNTLHHFMALQEQMLACEDLFQVMQLIENKAIEMKLRAYVRLLDASPLAKYALDTEYWQRFTVNHFNGHRVFLGRMRKVDRDGLFGERSGAPEFGSYVVLPLESHSVEGILAFSSDDGGHFQPAMDTLFLRYLAVVLSHLIKILPWKRS
ncbi:DUF484 family protein [Vibrio sp. PP-XX7]